MSYMLQFPPSKLPPEIASPPYVLFGINDLDAFSHLPTTIPLALVLHFAPALRKWILPEPELSPAAIRIALRTPYVGINILADIELEGLGWILARMMQIANLRMSVGNYDMYLTTPNLLTSIAIHKAWMALELPLKGIESLHAHMVTTLMMGPPVVLLVIKGIWHNFSIDSPVMREMGLNFVRNYIDGNYPTTESSPIRYWYLETKDRYSFFQKLEKRFPAFEEVQERVMKAATERQKAQDAQMKDLLKAQREADIIHRMLVERSEKGNLKRARKDKEDRESRASMRRLERATSNASLSSAASVETVVWNPLTEQTEQPGASTAASTPASENSVSLHPQSQPVDQAALFAKLKVEEQLQQERTKEWAFAQDEASKLDALPANPPRKLKLKHMPASPPKFQKFRTRAVTDAGLKLAVRAPAIAEEMLSPNSLPENIDNGRTASEELPSHEQILVEISTVNEAIIRRAAGDAVERGSAVPGQELNKGMLEAEDGLIYLQPSVYKAVC